MNKKCIGVFVIMMLLLGLSGDMARAESWKDFSADTVNTIGGQSIRGKVFITKNKTRMETPQSIMITRLDRQVAWILMPTQSAYMEQVLDPTMLPKVSKEMPGEIERVLISSETVNGQSAQKYKISYTQGGRQDSVYQWLGTSEIPLKVEALDGSWSMEYRNIREGAQDDALFEVPAGWQKFAMPVLPSNMQAMAEGGLGGNEP